MTGKILLADDEKETVEIIQKRLARGGFEVYCANDGKQALDLALKYLPDLIITDMVMPGMSGFEFCKAVKSHNDLKETPIIVVSAKQNMMDSFYYLGIKDFLPKPVALDTLEERVKMRLESASHMHTQKTKIIFHCVKATAMSAGRALIGSVPQWNAVFVQTGQELLATANEFLPDVIVVDLFMTDIPADEVIAKLKTLPGLSATVILTYYSPISAAQDGLALQARMLEVQYLKRLTAEAGAKEYLGPFKPENFLGLFKEYRRDLIPTAQ